jgi:hypothetical protein
MQLLEEAAAGDETPAQETAGAPLLLPDRLAGLPDAERMDLVLDLVRQEAAKALGHAAGTDIGPDDDFLDLGFTSLAAVEFGNSLRTATELDIALSIVYDCPTPRLLAEYVMSELSNSGDLSCTDVS